MTAYVIADVQVTDTAAYEPYRPLAAASIARFGGRFLVRGGEVELLEGEPQPERIVVIKFADAETARRWYRSEKYQRALKIRQAASEDGCSSSKRRASHCSWRADRRPSSTVIASGSQPPPAHRSAPRHGAGSGFRLRHRARRV